MEKNKREKNPTSVRLPEELKEKLEEIGKKQTRSVSNLIVCICWEYVKKYDELNAV